MVPEVPPPAIPGTSLSVPPARRQAIWGRGLHRGGLRLHSLRRLSRRHALKTTYLRGGSRLSADPTVARLREAARMLGDDIWIAVKLPGEFEGDDDLDDGTAIRRWTTVVLHPDELGWLREALALDANDEDPGDDEDGE